MHKYSSALASVGLVIFQLASLPVHAAPPLVMPVQILDPANVCVRWDAGGTLLAPTLTCVPAVPGAPAVPACTLTANGVNPLTITATGTVALSATCTNTDANTTYAWTGTGVAAGTSGASPSGQSLTVSATSTFSVIATNATGPSPAASVTVTVGAAPPPPPPPPAAGATCTISGKSFAVVDVGALGITNPLFTTGVGSASVAVATLKVPSGYSTKAGAKVSIYASNNGSGSREVWLSQTRCDQPGAFVPSLGQDRAPDVGWLAPNLYFTIDGLGINAVPKSVDMHAGETWYLHVISAKITSAGPGSWCSSCNFGITWDQPPQ
jgi:hypothetical protein